MSDTLRYTVVVEAENYSNAVRLAVSWLTHDGYTAMSLKNYWGQGNGYSHLAIYPFHHIFHLAIIPVEIYIRQGQEQRMRQKVPV